jgi:hypothetical protein
MVMPRAIAVFIGVLSICVAACSTSVRSVPNPDSTSTAQTTPVADTTCNALLREQQKKLAEIQREYANCTDLHDFARMVKLARARHAELEKVIREVHKMNLPQKDHERVLTPLRQERDWQLQVIQAASGM